MKNQNNGERLSDSIGRADDRIVEEALLAENAADLKRLEDKRQGRVNGKVRPTVLWRRIAVAAACLLLAVGLTAGLVPLLIGDDTTPVNAPGGLNNPVGTYTPGGYDIGSPETGPVLINSLDKLNYYGGKKMLIDSGAGGTSGGVASAQRTPAASVVTLGGRTGAQVSHLSSGGTDTGRAYSDEDLVYYYDISEWGEFSISGATFFQFTLTDENVFLASKIGTGLIDVVITDNNIDQMITFRNGEYFYSCLNNGGGNNNDGTGYIQFSSHKYIDGFNIVKNFEQENYAFEIMTNGALNVFSITNNPESIVSLYMYPFKSGVSGGGSFTYQIEPGSCLSKQMDVTYSIAELEAYFSNVLPQTEAEKTVVFAAGSVLPPVAGMEAGAYRIDSVAEAEQYRSLIGDITLTDDMFAGNYFLIVYDFCGLDSGGYLSHTLNENEIILLAYAGDSAASGEGAFAALLMVSAGFDDATVTVKWEK